jgi:hypothetical protein
MRDGVPTMTNAPAVFFINDKGGRPVSINRVLGQRLQAAFGNSDGDPQARMDHRRHRCVPGHAGVARRRAARVRLRAGQRPASPVGTFTQALYDEARKKGWTVICIKVDWKRVFAFE